MKIEKVLEQRGSRYGDFKDNAELAQALLKKTLDAPGAKRLTPVHIEAVHMIFHKISRMVNGDIWYDDNMTDVEGYASLLKGFQIAHNEANEEVNIFSPQMIEGGE